MADAWWLAPRRHMAERPWVLLAVFGAAKVLRRDQNSEGKESGARSTLHFGFALFSMPQRCTVGLETVGECAVLVSASN